MVGLPRINECREFSEHSLADLKSKFSELALPPDWAVVVNGSLARREATPTSDVDYFLLYSGKVLDKERFGTFEGAMGEAINSLGLKAPALGGAFGGATAVSKFIENVGGRKDTNDALTKRMLFMLEGDCVYGQSVFESARNQLVDVYLKPDLSDHQLARFFLNDLVRYWRTLTVDFEFKVTRGGKGWGTRNIKLMFSRKLIYFSGLLMVAETAQATRNAKCARLVELSEMNPLARVSAVCGVEANRALEWYETFLERLSDKDFRASAEETKAERAGQSEEFRALKNLGQRFSWELDRLLTVTYGAAHPIHHALVF